MDALDNSDIGFAIGEIVDGHTGHLQEHDERIWAIGGEHGQRLRDLESRLDELEERVWDGFDNVGSVHDRVRYILWRCDLPDPILDMKVELEGRVFSLWNGERVVHRAPRAWRMKRAVVRGLRRVFYRV